MTSKDHQARKKLLLAWSGFGQGLLLAAGIAICMAALGGALAYHQGVRALDKQLADKLSFSSNVLANEIERLRHLPRILGEDMRLQNLLVASPAPTAVAAANSHLKRLRGMSDADEIYFIGPDGVTLAASNWDEPGSFVGMSYAFRPYFLQGMAEGEAHYYAIGVTTGKPGAFLSAKVTAANGISGLAVVKMDLSSLENAWARSGELTLVNDELGVTFLASHAQWRFRPLQDLTPEAAQMLQEEQRYAGIDLIKSQKLPLSGDYLYQGFADTYRIRSGDVAQSNWRMIVALPLSGVNAQAFLFAALSAAGGALATLAVVILYQRRQIMRLRLIEADRLERAVRQRTADLAAEINERRRTEQELRNAQEGLVHAAKLAVLGRMSSAIVHEIGQSLSALDNSLAAAQLHGQGYENPKLSASHDRARRMLMRLQGVVVRLRSFGAKQSLVKLGPTDPQAALITAQEIIAPRAAEIGVEINLPNGPLPLILADAARLEQVLSNLLLNAVEASAAAAPPRQIDISVQDCPIHRVEILIADNGVGFAQDFMPQIGRPFATFGKNGSGMGLGLYIVQNLMEQMEGAIDFSANPKGRGALVRLRFGAAKERK